MSIFEYDAEEEMRKYRKAEHEVALEEGLKEGIEQGNKQGELIGLAALVGSLRPLLPDFEAVYHAITANEAYKDYSREQIQKYYDKLG
ncbi:MAG: hypothetical protein ACI4VG_07360 [Lachnospiraceae bacterium]